MKINQFILKDSGQTVAIPASLRKQTLLFFMRAANCPVCIQHVRQIEKLLPELTAKDTEAIVVVPEGVVEAQKLKNKYHLSMPVLAGDGLAHATVGLNKKLLGSIQQSGTLIVSATGDILYSKTATIPLESFSHKEVRTFLHI